MLLQSKNIKKLLVTAIKILVLGMVLWLINERISGNQFYTFEHLKNGLRFKTTYGVLTIIGIFVLSSLNWLLEVKKWQYLVSFIQKIPLKKAFKETLAGSTLTFITPAKIGDYGIKAAYYPKEKRKDILLLNFAGNMAQLLITVVLGVLACSYLIFIKKHVELKQPLLLLFIAAGIGLLILYKYKSKEWFFKGFSFENLIHYFKKIATPIWSRVVLISLMRYFIFSTTFYLLLFIFGVPVLFYEAIVPIFTMYFFASIVPSFFIFDPAVRGGIAAILLIPSGVDPLPVLCAALAMWLLNFAIPALIGSYFVITFKPQKTV